MWLTRKKKWQAEKGRKAQRIRRDRQEHYTGGFLDARFVNLLTRQREHHREERVCERYRRNQMHSNLVFVENALAS